MSPPHSPLMRVMLATCCRLPEPDPDALLLLEALRARRLDARLGAWDDPETDWAGARLVVLRSTWNYYRRPPEFLAWAEHVSRAARLLNPTDVVRWNHHKGYLEQLEARGVPIAPTAFLGRATPTPLAEVMETRGWVQVVVKPAISASSYRTARFDRASLKGGEAHLAALLKDGDALVQEYLPSVEGYGERALVWIDGEFTHAVRKAPRLMGEDEAVSPTLPIAGDERLLGLAALEGFDARRLLYARVDLARDGEGRPRLMELELIEPSLFLAQHPPALERFAEAILRRAEEEIPGTED